ncbi:hypothetical protein BDQ17DRAFT_1355025 [Cyathus striatus]|nr:hypothetical protein BDQ17DRAFT_1355025 [Cyathus striatus]
MQSAAGLLMLIRFSCVTRSQISFGLWGLCCGSFGFSSSIRRCHSSMPLSRTSISLASLSFKPHHSPSQFVSYSPCSYFSRLPIVDLTAEKLSFRKDEACSSRDTWAGRGGRRGRYNRDRVRLILVKLRTLHLVFPSI